MSKRDLSEPPKEYPNKDNAVENIQEIKNLLKEKEKIDDN